MRRLGKTSIKFLRKNINNINMKIYPIDGNINMNIKELEPKKIFHKQLDYNLNKFQSYLFVDDYSVWRKETGKIKKQYWSNDCFLENAEIPRLSEVFYFLFYIFERVPTPEEFFYGYLDVYCNIIDQHTFEFLPEFEPKYGERRKPLPPKETLYLNTLKCRITNSYPSFLREVGCLLMLLELNTSDELQFYYDFNDDINNDSDICCIKNNIKISISLFNNTGISIKKRLEKEKNNSKKHNTFKIIVLANFINKNNFKRNLQRYGSIELYNLESIKKIISIAKNSNNGYYVIG